MSTTELDAVVRELIEALEARGFDVVADARGGRYHRVLYDERPVLDPATRDPLILPWGIGDDEAWRQEVVQSLRRAQAIEDDPRERPEEPEPPDPLAERAAAIFGPLGVWEPSRKGKYGWRGTQGEVARAAFAFAEARGLESAPPSEQAAKYQVRNLFEGKAAERLEFMEAFLDELEAAPDPGERYDELVDELGILKGRAVEPEPEAEAEAEAEPETPARETLASDRTLTGDQLQDIIDLEADLAQAKAELETARQQLAGAAEAHVPELALEALCEMIGQHVWVGDDQSIAGALEMLEAKKERALSLAKRIAALELGAD